MIYGVLLIAVYWALVVLLSWLWWGYGGPLAVIAALVGSWVLLCSVAVACFCIFSYSKHKEHK